MRCMTNENLDEILPAPSQQGEQDSPTVKKPRSRWFLFSLLGLLGLLLVAALSGFGGYWAGIDLRKGAEVTQVALASQEQFQLAVQDLQEKRFGRAQQRLDYLVSLRPAAEQASNMAKVLFEYGIQANLDGRYAQAQALLEYTIQLDPSLPGAADELANALLAINATATPTPAITPTTRPTADQSGLEGLFSQAEGYFLNSDWTNAIDTLLAVRKEDAIYRAVDVDGMLYLALRNRGIDKISKEADLEGGMYDLSQSERFGPLDAEAQGYLTWSSMYVTGASFWELDWRQAVFYFEQVAPQWPGLRDGSGWTASERYRLALIGLGKTLIAEEQSCQAVETLQLALSYGADPQGEEALNEASERCGSGADEKKDKDKQQEATEPPAAEEPTPYPPP
jgi:tetratricopeptide (TPR) repeat protein